MVLPIIFQTAVFARKLQFSENRNTLHPVKFPFSVQNPEGKEHLTETRQRSWGAQMRYESAPGEEDLTPEILCILETGFSESVFP